MDFHSPWIAHVENYVIHVGWASKVNAETDEDKNKRKVFHLINLPIYYLISIIPTFVDLNQM